MTHCINCNQEVSTAYCPACGQRNPVKKINMVNMWSDFASRVYGFDGMFPRTLRDLTIRPGQAAREYIKGNRVKYYGPVGYFFLTLTIYLLVASLLEVDLTNFMMQTGPNDMSAQGDGMKDVMTELTSWVVNNMRSVSFFITLCTVFFTWLLFRKSNYNFVETGALVFFVTGHTMWLSIVLMLVYKVTGFVVSSTNLALIAILFMTYAYTDFYTHKSKWRIVVRGLFAHFFSYLALIVVISIIFVYRISTDKELFEKIRPLNNKPKVEQNPSVK